MNPNNEIITPKKTLELVNQAFEIIINQNKYYMKKNKKDIDLNTIKSIYNGFYAGFKLLLELPDLPSDIKFQLIAKKSIIDKLYFPNITYPEFNMLKLFKSDANKKNTENLKKYLILALQNTPEDFVFENIKPMLKSALSIVEKVEKKRNKREQSIVANNNLGMSKLNDDQLKNIMNNLENMIKEQEKNIENLKKPSQDNSNQNLIIND